MRLLLVRHGQTHSNVSHALDTQFPGADLTELGRRQASALVEELAEEPIESIWVSNLVRTHQTAEPLARARGLTPLERDGLREISAGDLEMRSDKEAVYAYLEGVMAWGADPDARMPGGETGREVMDRYDAVVGEIADTGQETALIVSHGGIIVSWAAATVEVPRQFLGRAISNTGVVIIEGSPAAGWELVRWESHALGGEALTDVSHDGPLGYPDARFPDSLAVAGKEFDIDQAWDDSGANLGDVGMGAVGRREAAGD